MITDVEKKTFVPRAAPRARAEFGLHLLIFLFLLITFGYVFHENPGDNVMNRVDFLYAAVHLHTMSIDPYADNTVDEAFYNGHSYYSEAVGSTAPGVAILAAYARLSGDDNSDPYNSVPLYLLTLLLASLPAALLGAMLFAYLRRFSEGVFDRLVVTLSFSLGTLAFPYSTLYFDYQLSALLCFAAFLLVDKAVKGRALTAWRLLIIGFLLSYAVVTQYDTFLIALPVLAYLLINLTNKKRFLYCVIGAAPALALLAVYNQLCFGSPFAIGLFHLASAEQWRGLIGGGVLGITHPRPAILLDLLFAPGRGLAWQSPFLFFSVPGFIAGIRRVESRPFSLICLSVVISYLLFNSSFAYYGGGASPGPRHLVPALAFVAIPAFFWLRRASGFFRCLYLSLVLSSAFAMAMISITFPHVSSTIQSPIYSVAMPLFINGYVTTNAGTLIGLKGVASVLPYLAFALVFAVLAVALTKRLTPSAAFRPVRPSSSAAWITALLAVLLLNYAGFMLSDYDHVEPVLMRAKRYLIIKNYPAAVREYAAAIKLGGADETALFGRAFARMELGETKGAVDDLKQLIEIAPDHVQGRHYLAKTLYSEYGDLHAAATHYKILLGNNLAADPTISYSALVITGLDLKEAKQYDEAIARFLKAITIIPGSVEARDALVQLYVSKYAETGNIDYARLAGRRIGEILAIEPSRFADAGEMDADEILWTYVVRKNPENAVALNYLGEVYYKKGRLEEAQNLFAHAAAIDGDLFAPRVNLGVISTLRGDYVSAIKHLEAARSLKADHPTVLLNLGIARLKTAHPDLAASLAEELLKVDPKNPGARHLLCKAYSALGRDEEALAHCKAYLELKHDEREGMMSLAHVLFKLKRVEEAIDIYSRVLDRLPGYAPARINAGVCYYQLGDNASAIKAWKKVLQSDPDNKKALQLLESVRSTAAIQDQIK